MALSSFCPSMWQYNTQYYTLKVNSSHSRLTLTSHSHLTLIIVCKPLTIFSAYIFFTLCSNSFFLLQLELGCGIMLLPLMPLLPCYSFVEKLKSYTLIGWQSFSTKQVSFGSRSRSWCQLEIVQISASAASLFQMQLANC